MRPPLTSLPDLCSIPDPPGEEWPKRPLPHYEGEPPCGLQRGRSRRRRLRVAARGTPEGRSRTHRRWMRRQGLAGGWEFAAEAGRSRLY